MAVAAGSTTFTRDVQGRFLCDTLGEALASTRGGASRFHHIVIGGGLLGGTLASFLMNLDPASPAFGDPFPRHHSRVLVLEAGPMLLPEHEQNPANIGVGVPDGPAFLAGLHVDLRCRRKRQW